MCVRPRAGESARASCCLGALLSRDDMSDGRNGGFQLLRPETVPLVPSLAVGGGIDFLMAGSGLDWPIFTEEPHEMWGKTADLRGMQ